MNYEQKTYLRKQFGFCLREQCCKLINHLCNSDGPCTPERGGHVFHIKDKLRMLTRILKDSGTTWQPDLELMISRGIFNKSEFLTISKVQKLTQGARSRAELGRCRVLGLATTPSQLKSYQQLFCKTLLQKSRSIKKNKTSAVTEQSIPTKSCRFKVLW